MYEYPLSVYLGLEKILILQILLLLQCCFFSVNISVNVPKLA